jgi:flavin-dependent dehydrogenase
MSGQDYDVAVIGGGPAGCSAAVRLAGSGYRVVLFEARTYPHDKMCGEFLSPECSGLLEDLGAAGQLAALNPAPIRSARLTAPGGAAWEAHLSGTAWGLSRRALDAALAERAVQVGVDVREGTRVAGVAGRLGEGFEVEAAARAGQRRVRARTVIAAHGKRDALDGSMGRRFVGQRHPFVALKAHFHGPSVPGRVELNAFPGGYCGFSEIENDVRVVCLLAHEAAFRAAARPGRHPIETFVEWMQTQNPRLEAWLSQAERIHERWIGIAQVHFGDKRVIVGDVLMAGDAAGLIVPLAGDGIAMALEGGVLAAGYLAGYLAGDRSAADVRRAYPAAWRRRFGGRLRLGRLLQPMMLRPRALGVALRLLAAYPPLGRYLVAHTRGGRP